MCEDEKKYKQIYNREIKKVENRIARIFKNKIPASLYKPSEYIMTGGGKRIRPFLVLGSAKAVGGEFKDVYNAAVAVELLHNFTLVHDDIMDNADKRRNRLTLHKKYDTGTAILTGDSLTAFAYKYLLKDAGNNYLEAINFFTDGVIEVCEGQSLDADFEKRKNVTIAEYKKMISQKTAALLKMCCAIGGVLGGGSAEDLKNLKEYGKNLGMAFQLQDDYLDIAGNEKHFGKPIGGDLVEGKKTFLLLKALEIAKGQHKKDLMKIIKNSGINKKDVLKYKTIYEELGVFELTEKEIKKYTRKALSAANKLKDEEGKNLLICLAEDLLGREK